MALLEAERRLADNTLSLNDFNPDCQAGLCFNGALSIGDCSPGQGAPWREARVWHSESHHQTVTLSIEGISARARYIIEFRCYVPKDVEGPLPDLANGNDWAQYFRITALATGGTKDARVMLQTTYKKNNS